MWRDRKGALFGQFVAGLANVGVHPEHLVQNDDGGSRQGLRPRDISTKRAVPAFNGDAIFHCVLLRRRLSGPPPMSSSGSAEAHYRAKRVQHGGPALRLAKRHFTLLPRLPERLFPLFGSHRARGSASAAWARGRPLAQQAWAPCALARSGPSPDGP